MRVEGANPTVAAGSGKEALARTVVLIVGGGALGNEVARLLALAGVGRLAMVVPAPDGQLSPQVLAAARIAGIEEVLAGVDRDRLAVVSAEQLLA